MWIKSVLGELSYDLKHIPVNADNQGSIFIRSNPVQERRTKHIDIRYHYICECIKNEDISIFSIEGKENPADTFTKNLPVTPFLKFWEALGITFETS